MPEYRKYIPLLILIALLLITAAISGLVVQKKSVEEQNELDAFFNTAQIAVYEPVLPGEQLSLPEDFLFHPEFQHEWWRYSATLKDKEGTRYGVQWSFFRMATDEKVASGWQTPQLYLAYVVITSEDKVWREERIARGGIGQAGLRARPFRLWMDNWVWRSIGNMPLPGLLSVDTDTFSLSLSSTNLGPYIEEGDQGYIQKHNLAHYASYGLSVPFLSVSGQLKLGDKLVSVTGDAVLQKEWSSDLMNQRPQKSIQFSLRLGQGKLLTIYQNQIKEHLPYTYGTLVTNDGDMVKLDESDIVITPKGYYSSVTGKLIPVVWSVNIPGQNIDINIKPLRNQSWHPFLTPYWEGPVVSPDNSKISGYLQLMGY